MNDMEERCHTRIVTSTGTNYMVSAVVDEVLAQAADPDGWIDVISMTGQSLFPPERLCIRTREIAVVQEISEAAWIWTTRATELHYVRQMQELESPPSQQMADAQQQLVDLLADGIG